MSRRGASRLLLSACAAALCGAGSARAAEFLRRDAWGAKPPAFAMPRHRPRHISIHHTATRQRPGTSLASKMRSLQRFSQSAERLADGRQKAAWADIPYHFYIGADGTVAEGRDMGFAGDTNTAYAPDGHIGIAVEGNFERETPSAAQVDALVDTIVWVALAHGLGAEAVGTHRHHAATACPGAALTARMPEIVARVAARL